jgi:hypothetical protein
MTRPRIVLELSESLTQKVKKSAEDRGVTLKDWFASAAIHVLTSELAESLTSEK